MYNGYLYIGIVNGCTMEFVSEEEYLEYKRENETEEK